MKALQKTERGPGHLRMREVPEPACGPGQIKIKVAAAGICGTDLRIAHDEADNRPPITLGHEIAGVVEETGAGVTRARVGDKVTVSPYMGVVCGHCRYCRAGYYALCSSRLTLGISVDGGFARYCVVQDDQTYKLPDDMALEVGSLAEALACSVQAVSELSHVEPGDRVLIAGPGPVGLLTLQLVKMQGAKAIVSGLGRDRHRLETARQMGADIIVDVESQSLREVLRGLGDGGGADFAFECAGEESALNQCIDSVRKMGTVVVLGLYPGKAQISPSDLVTRQLTVRGSISHSWGTWDRTLAIMREHRVNLAPIITHRLPLSEWQEGFRLAEERVGLKVILQPE
ncbi:MAG: zinc-dependent alcohol dehydrogenase [Chloroflexota bacterium]